MEIDTAPISEALLCIKVHCLMCTELMKYVDRISQIFPAIESARPRCRSGLEALCSLNLAVEKAKLIIQHCTESSKFYLAITGEAITFRCVRVQKALGLSLSQIQDLVPVPLAAQISVILNDLYDANFTMETYEQEAGNALLGLLRQESDSTDASELKAFQIAAVRLCITSSKDLLIEKRSVKKLIAKIGDSDPKKEKILKYLLYLLRKYGQSVGGDQTVNASVHCEHPRLASKSACTNDASGQSIPQNVLVEYAVREVQTNVSNDPIPLDEFKCPISQRIMYDPVVIASGQTFERMWIEKWFRDGHDTCPRTQKKLSQLSITPNTAMKDLISKWCRKHGISIPDPCSHHIPAEVYSWTLASSSSIASFGSSINNIPIRNDSSESFCCSDVEMLSISTQVDNDQCSCLSFLNFSQREDPDFFFELSGFPWKSQCIVMEDVKTHLKDHEQASHSILSSNFVQSVVRFLKDACDCYDVKAQRVGTQLLLILVSNIRDEVPSFCQDVFFLLVSFLDSEIAEEALEIMQVLSGDQCGISNVVASGALPSILKILDSQSEELLVPAVKVLCNLSSSSTTCSHLLRLGYIPKLTSFLGDGTLARHCIRILKDICKTEEGRTAIAGGNECVTSIAELLEAGSHDEQEHAVEILLSLCSHCSEYCYLVMKDGVIPSLVSISINGNVKGRKNALELLGVLRDISYTNSQEHLIPAPESNLELPCEPGKCSSKIHTASRARFFTRKIKLFAKPRSLALF